MIYHNLSIQSSPPSHQVVDDEIDQLRDEVELLTQQRDVERRKSISLQDRVIEAESVQEENEKLQDLLQQVRNQHQESQHKSEELSDEIDALQRRLNSTVALHNEDLNELTRLQQQIKKQERRRVT